MDAKTSIRVFMLAACMTTIFVHSEPDSGCNETSLGEKAGICENEFFKATIQGEECSEMYAKFVACMKTTIVSCYSKLPEETTGILVEASMGLVKARQFYCNDTALNINLTAVPEEVRGAVSCKEAYFDEGATCANDFRKKFTTNSKNTELCSMYKDVQECSNKAAETYCSAVNSTKETTNVFCSTTSETTRAAARPLMLVFVAVTLISVML